MRRLKGRGVDFVPGKAPLVFGTGEQQRTSYLLALSTSGKVFSPPSNQRTQNTKAARGPSLIEGSGPAVKTTEFRLTLEGWCRTCGGTGAEVAGPKQPIPPSARARGGCGGTPLPQSMPCAGPRFYRPIGRQDARIYTCRVVGLVFSFGACHNYHHLVCCLMQATE